MSTTTAASAGICCFWCGYDLTGLELPRSCPECGRSADAGLPARAEQARSWFRRRAAWFWWLRGRSKLPADVWYVLYDPGSVRLARLREFRLIWLPIFLSCLIVVFGNCLTVTYNVRTWYYRRWDPARRLISETKSTEVERLFAVNLHFDFHLGVLFNDPPAFSVPVVERTRGRWSIGAPDFDPVTSFLAGMPWAIVIAAYLPGRWLSVLLPRRTGLRYRNRVFRRSVASACSLISLLLGFAFWAWLGLVMMGGIILAGWLPNRNAEWLAWPFVFLAAAPVALTGLVAWPRLMSLDHARAVFPHRGLWTVFQVAWGVILPAIILLCSM